MKKSILVIFVIGIVIVFFGCQEESAFTPELSQTEQVPKFLAKESHTDFTGESRFEDRTTVIPTFLPNDKILVKGEISYWNDVATDPRVTGQSIWYINKKVERDGSVNVWGKGELITDYEGGGKWDMSWHGTVLPSPDFPIIVDYVVGTGKEGSVKGLVAKWVYKSVDNPDPGFPFIYQFEGYIVEK